MRSISSPSNNLCPGPNWSLSLACISSIPFLTETPLERWPLGLMKGFCVVGAWLSNSRALSLSKRNFSLRCVSAAFSITLTGTGLVGETYLPEGCDENSPLIDDGVPEIISPWE